MPDHPTTQNQDGLEARDSGSLLRVIADAIPASMAYFEAETLRCRFAKTRGRPGDKHYVARCHLILLCGCPFTIKTPDGKAQGQTTGGDVTPCHIVLRALALSDLRGRGQ